MWGRCTGDVGGDVGEALTLTLTRVHLAARRGVERAAALVREVVLEARVVHVHVALGVQRGK